MTAGPPPKDPSKRVRSNTAMVGMVANRLAEIPKPAGKWLAQTRDEWRTLFEHALTGAYEETDLPALRRLFGLRDQRTRFERQVAQRPLVPGSQGQVVLNPLARQVAAIDAEIRALEDRFGLSPSARLRLGITLGEAAKTLADLQAGFDDQDDGRFGDVV